MTEDTAGDPPNSDLGDTRNTEPANAASSGTGATQSSEPGKQPPAATADEDADKGETELRWRDRRSPWLRRWANSWWPLPRQLPDDAQPARTTYRRDGWHPLLRGIVDNLYRLPLDPPERFPQRFDALVERLTTDDDALADELLADAQSLYDDIETRVRSTEARAATLQGTVAIAATVALAGAGLVLDASKIHGNGWRTAFAVGLGLLVLLLVLTAFRATSASSRIFDFAPPSDDDILDRAKLSPPRAKTRRAAALLYCYGRNNEVAALKVGALRAAAFWFRGALVALLALVAMVCVYVVHIDSQHAKTTATATPAPGHAQHRHPNPKRAQHKHASHHAQHAR